MSKLVFENFSDIQNLIAFKEGGYINLPQSEINEVLRCLTDVLADYPEARTVFDREVYKKRADKVQRP